MRKIYYFYVALLDISDWSSFFILFSSYRTLIKIRITKYFEKLFLAARSIAYERPNSFKINQLEVLRCEGAINWLDYEGKRFCSYL